MAIISLFDLPEASTLSGAEIFPVNQDGTTKRTAISSIGGGIGSETNGEQASVLAGSNNKALSSFGVVVQGCNNYLKGGSYNTIINGKNNCNISNYYSTIIGGCNNKILSADTQFSTILNGVGNCVCAGRISLMGGGTNTIITPGNDGNVILNGFSSSMFLTNNPTSNNIIGNGLANYISDGSQNSIINGNLNFHTKSSYSFIGGGTLNFVLTSAKSSILGGALNRICQAAGNTSQCSTILGGYNNVLSGAPHSIIGAGSCNQILAGLNSGILGGQNNILSGSDSFIIGSNICNANKNCTTFVNNLSAQCSLHAGNGITCTFTLSSTSGNLSIVITDGIITGIS